jgi:hypothetical protein
MKSEQQSAVGLWSAPGLLPLPKIAGLVEHGQVTVGTFPSRSCERETPQGETLGQLLTRLDLALAKAGEDTILTEEVNLSRSR